MSLPPVEDRALTVLIQERAHLQATTDSVRRLAAELPGANLGGLVKKLEDAWQELEGELEKRMGA